MLYSLRGILVHAGADGVAVECAGVAYFCQVTLSTLSRLDPPGTEVLLYTYMNVREDAVDLFGFFDQSELSCFKMLIAVTGVGPKVALNILSCMTPERFAMCVAAADHKSITAAQGVGPKLAQRIVLELKDKIKNADIAAAVGQSPANLQLDSGNAAEAISALVVLGYAQADAASLISRMDASTPVEEMIKQGLRGLSGS